jgi:hypothetical protein
MNIERLKALLDISNRKNLYKKILSELELVNQLNHVSYQIHQRSEIKIPVIKIANNSKINECNHVKVFVGAQHNEYNGLFSILKFFKLLREKEIELSQVTKPDQILIFLPLLNPYGFKNPKKSNKSGYYLENGTNLNRYWCRAFIPEINYENNNLNGKTLPEQVIIVKQILQEYWDKHNINLYLLDFHETSLLERYPFEMYKSLNPFYKFDHWLKEGIILNIMKLYDIPYYRKPLFFKCNPSADHTHLNLTHKQFERVFDKFKEYISKNQGKGKLAFYFCYNDKSKDYCIKLANIVYNNMKEKLWETYFPGFNHNFINHGCFVNMSNLTSRPNIYSMELESQKHFFNIFEEISKSNSDPNYFEKKLNLINISIDLALEAIKVMINII